MAKLADELVRDLGLRDEFEGEGVAKAFRKAAKVALLEKQRDDFAAKRASASKLDVLRMFPAKADGAVAPFLAPRLSRYESRGRDIAVRLLLGHHGLKQETGRWSGVAPEDRHCECCSTGEVESALHFALECEARDELIRGFCDKVAECDAGAGRTVAELTNSEAFRFFMTPNLRVA